MKGVNKMSEQRRILIIDDDRDFQTVLKQCLNKEGYNCTTCDSAEEALEQVREETPDLVILDLGFRQASGLAFLENFTAAIDQEEKVPPVMVVSGYSDPEIIEFVTNRGASAFLSKPVGSSQLISAVRSFIH